MREYRRYVSIRFTFDSISYVEKKYEKYSPKEKKVTEPQFINTIITCTLYIYINISG